MCVFAHKKNNFIFDDRKSICLFDGCSPISTSFSISGSGSNKDFALFFLCSITVSISSSRKAIYFLTEISLIEVDTNPSFLFSSIEVMCLTFKVKWRATSSRERFKSSRASFKR